ncbi:hypothetical protein TB2_000086 [Malus domestica]
MVIELEGGRFQWRKPLFGELKLNCDAAWRSDSKRKRIGWVLRDFAGIPKLAGGVGGDRYGSVMMVEAEAVREGMKVIINCEIMEDGIRLMVESDSNGLVQCLNKEAMVDVSLEVYLHDIWRMMRFFQLVKFCFTPRQCNRVAYSVAAYVVKHGERFGWDELGPEFLFNVLAEDANVAIRI